MSQPTTDFALYGSIDPIDLAELVQRATNGGDLLARVEDSGSEGLYCEVAIWQESAEGSKRAGAWYRYAFRKFLGGEPATALEDATAAANAINEATWHKGRVAMIHNLPEYKECNTTLPC